MKKISTLLLLIMLCFPSFSQQRKKVGLVLAGGGAKGTAHIGVLKVLEECGIPIDYIAGTSMGAIIGGLYSIGYTANELDSLVKNQDWTHLLSDNVYRENKPTSEKENPDAFILSLPYGLKGQVKLPAGFVSGQNIYNLFLNLTIGYHENTDFNHFPIPFRCVAANVRNGKAYVFENGALPEAMRASMAIPGFFAPIEKDSMLLIDGGAVNNYPVDLVKKMGADIIIGVQFPEDEKAMESHQGSMLEIMDYLNNFMGKELLEKNIRQTDLIIQPDLHPYSMASFQIEAMDTIINRGEQAARAKWNEMMAVKKQVEASAGCAVERCVIINPFIRKDSIDIKSIHIEGLNPSEEEMILKRIKLNNRITRTDLQKTVEKLYGTNFFSKVFYRLDGDSIFNLVFNIEKKEVNILNLGARFDTEDLAAILANTTLRFNKSLNSMFDITARLSKNPYLYIHYSLNKSMFYKGGISYMISRNNLNIYEKGKLGYSFGVTKNAFNLNFSEFYIRNIKLHAGVNFDYFYYFSPLKSNVQSADFELKNKLYINYFIEGVFDNLNKNYFPTSGQYFSFRYAIHTDNFYQMKGVAPSNIVSVKYRVPLKIADEFYVTPQLDARAIFNDSVPLIYQNVAGARFDSHYLPQQISMEGSKGMEWMENILFKAQTEFRYHIKSQHAIYANVNFLVHNDKITSLFDGNKYYGGILGYSYNTIIGPLNLELGYSSLSKSVYPFVSFGYYF